MAPEVSSTPEVAPSPAGAACTVWTVGHSTLAEPDFLALLGAYDVEALADVRRFPASKRYPHFNADALSAALHARGVAYLGLRSLGGRRPTTRDSPHTGWRNDSFRGYADHMGTEEFRAGLRELCELAGRKRTAIMCAESLWWRCHRSLIADSLKAGGWRVIHILTTTSSSEHPYTPPARMIDGRLAYPADQLSLGE